MNWLILTAAVVPSASSRVLLQSAEERLAQYQRSIARWHRELSGSGFKVAVVEASGVSRESLLAEVPIEDRSDVFTRHAEVPAEVEIRGKGASESFMLDAIIPEVAGRAEDTIYKVTGRLTMLNSHTNVIQLGARQAVVRMTLNRTYADTRCVGASFDVWRRHLSGLHLEIQESRGVNIENVLAGRLSTANACLGLELVRFSAAPQWAGASGTTLKHYGSERRVSDMLRRPIEAGLWRLAARKQV